MKQTVTIIRFLLLASLWLPNLCLFALDPLQPVDKFLVDEWRVDRGLPSDTINAIVQTGDGVLWIGTHKGLVRFDGLKFDVMTFDPVDSDKKKGRISTLFVDKKGVLWIGRSQGLTRYKNRTFHTFSSRDGLSGEQISGLCRDSGGSLWIGTANNYLNRLDSGTFTLFDTSKGLTGKFITAVVEDSHGFLWVGTLINGLHRYQYGKFTKVDIPGLTPRHSLHVLHEDRDGFLWVGTNMGLFRVKDGDVRIYTTRDGLSDNRVNAVLQDSDGNLWVGTVNGLNRINTDHKANGFIESRFENHYINCLFEDREKSLWVGTNGSALKRLREGVFTTYSTEQGVANFVSSLFKARDGTLWISTDYGQLYYYKDEKISEYPVEKDILDLRIRTLGDDPQGQLLVGTIRDGIFRAGKENLEPFPHRESLSGSIIQTIFRDSRDRLWIGTMGKGLFRVHNGVFKHYTVGDGLLSNVILHILEDGKRHIWVATSNGINLLPGGHFERIKPYLMGIFTLSIYEDSAGTFWVGTLADGLLRFKGGKYNVFTTKEGLGSDNIFHILEDRREYFWMSSDVGVLKVSKKELEKFFNSEIDNVHCTNYGISDGMKSIECNSWGRNSAVKTGSGEFWFATKRGVSVVDPGQLKTDKLPPPPVSIEKAVVNGTTIEDYRSVNDYKDDRTIEIYFTAATFVALERVKFKYKLEGFDRDWVFLTPKAKRSARYTNLPVGSYRFVVTACSSDGVWNETGASFDFTISSGFSVIPFLPVLSVILILSVPVFLLVRKKIKTPVSVKTKKYKTSTLDREKAEEIVKQLTRLLEFEKVYRDEKVSLQALAGELSVSYHQLSQVINEKMQKNFFDLINGYRIEEAKERLVDPGEGARSVLAIAYDVGFNTKAAFNRVFKKYTGMTPSQYRKEFKK